MNTAIPEESRPCGRRPASGRAAPLRAMTVHRRSSLGSGLRALLEECQDIRVVAEVGCAADLAFVVSRVRPDVVLLHLPDVHGDVLGTIRSLSGGDPPQRVVVYATSGGPLPVEEALWHGALGFVLVEDPAALTVEAVRAAAAGRSLISPALAGALISLIPPPLDVEHAHHHPLTDREVQLVRAVARGSTNAEISAQIWISLSTVKHHLADVQRKLGLRNRVEIAAWAWRTGLAAERPVLSGRASAVLRRPGRPAAAR